MWEMLLQYFSDMGTLSFPSYREKDGVPLKITHTLNIISMPPSKGARTGHLGKWAPSMLHRSLYKCFCVACEIVEAK